MRALMIGLTMAVAASPLARGAEVTSARHGVIAADKNQIVKFDEHGKPIWSVADMGPVHRIQQLPNGNILTQDGWTRLVEVTPQKKIVWEYDCATANGNAGKKLEVHAFQRLDDGRTMIVENGVGRVIEVDPSGKIVHEFQFRVSKPSPHRDVRQGYKLATGNYLLCHEGDGRVTEYSPSGEVVWDYAVPLFDKPPQPGHGPEAWGNQVFNALRLASENTLIATGNGHSVIEVTPKGEIVWQLNQRDLPGIVLAWTTTLDVLPDGHIVIGNCHAGPENPQLIEITREKQVVWTFRDSELLGDSVAASAIVTTRR